MVMRAGVWLTPLKARMYDIIKGSGADGIATDALYARLFANRSRDTMRAHIWQINDKLADSGERIAVSRGCEPTYRITRRRAAA